MAQYDGEGLKLAVRTSGTNIKQADMDNVQEKSFKENLATAWKMLINNWVLLFGTLFVLMILAVLGCAIVMALTLDLQYSVAMVTVALLFFAVFINTYFYKLVLRLVRGEEVSVKSCSPSVKQMFNWTVATLLVETGIVLGFMLFIIPGLYIATKWYPFSGFAAIDGESPFGSIVTSHRLTKGIFWQILAVTIVLLLTSLTRIAEIFTLFLWILAGLLFAVIYNQVKAKHGKANG